MDEFEIIRQYFTSHQSARSVIVGVGDDGAVLRPEAGRDLVTVVDTMISNVHFPAQMNATDVGFRAVVVNVSDIAAMGARPMWMTLALTFDDRSPVWLEDFAHGLFLAAETYDVELVGGDTTKGSEVVISIQITGDVGQGQALTRRGARPGDHIYVSGTVGDAACGLSLVQEKLEQEKLIQQELMQQKKVAESLTEAGAYLVNRFARPSARVELGREIVQIASAAIDLSDGLFADLGKMLVASEVAGCIETNRLPLSDALLTTTDSERAVQFALSGGDDYELCFTAPADAFGDEVAGVPVTCIGTVSAGSGLSCTRAGALIDYHHEGYRHFS